VPTTARSLVGRGFDVRHVRERLQPGTLTTFVGVGGVGKTVLALHSCGATDDAALDVTTSPSERSS
jgi:ABC-type glutathione transport system ATPase component